MPDPTTGPVLPLEIELALERQEVFTRSEVRAFLQRAQDEAFEHYGWRLAQLESEVRGHSDNKREARHSFVTIMVMLLGAGIFYAVQSRGWDSLLAAAPVLVLPLLWAVAEFVAYYLPRRD